MSGISDVNPFVGPRPIQQGEALFGRETEIRELYNQLKARRIVVLHSPSGAGKSSLVHAGLIPRLRKGKFDVWKPIRVNLEVAGLEGVPADTNRYLLSALLSLEDELPRERQRSPAELAELSLLEYLDSRPRRKGREDRSVVLLFDQFEEILSVAPRAVDAKEAFFAAVGEALDSDRYWALFILREDYLAAFAPYRDLIPTQMNNTFRIDLLGLDGAREAARGLAAKGGRSFPAVDKLIRDLSAVQVQQPDGTFVTEQGVHVEPVHLQVVCRRLWDTMPADDLSIDEDDIEAYAEVSTSLAGYYSDAVEAIAGDDAALERRIRDWVGTKLIVGGIRSQVRQETGESAGLDNGHIDELLGCYLVRTEQRAGANWFELSHDRLVEPVQASNDAWQLANLHPLQVQAKQWEDAGRAQSMLLGVGALSVALIWAASNPELLTPSEEDFLSQSKALWDDRARTRMLQGVVTALVCVVAVVAVVFGVVAMKLKAAAEEGRHDAERAQADAEAAREKAVQLHADAERARAEAEEAREQNELLARELLQQMFETSLRRFIAGLAEFEEDGDAGGEISVDAQWTPLIERGGQIFAAVNVLAGGGRIVVAGNDAVLSEVDADGDSLFVEISVRWLLGQQARRKVVIVKQHEGSYERLEILRRTLTTLGHEHELDLPLTSLAQSEEVGALIIDNRHWAGFGPEEVEAVEAFVRGGGGLLAVGSGHDWLELERGEEQPAPSLDSYPMNQLMRPFGVRWTDGIITPETFAAGERAGGPRGAAPQ